MTSTTSSTSSPSKISGLLSQLSKLSAEGRQQLAAQLKSNLSRREKFRKLYGYYPDHGDLRRALYPRHMEFFAAGGHEIDETVTFKVGLYDIILSRGHMKDQ